MTAREHRHRRAENLRKPRTVMANAFLEDLRKWVWHHANDINTTIAIPTGVRELARVVCALIAIQKISGHGRAG